MEGTWSSHVTRIIHTVGVANQGLELLSAIICPGEFGGPDRFLSYFGKVRHSSLSANSLVESQQKTQKNVEIFVEPKNSGFCEENRSKIHVIRSEHS
jgi:hypothetical protein